MAGVYVTFEESDQGRLDAVAARLRYGGENEAQHLGRMSYVWLGHDTAEQFAPALDPESGIHVVVSGRLCLAGTEWNRATKLPFRGGLASRIILDQYLKGGPESIAPYNGAAAIVIWDPRSSIARLWTDQFGYQPAFVCGTDVNHPSVFTTFPNAAAADPALTLTPDYVSMAEFLRAWRATPPNTYYREIKHAGAATQWLWDLKSGQVTNTVYWKPFEQEFYKSQQEAAESLATALRSAVSERTAAAKSTALFVSGGADSRVMLFGADDPTRITGVNLYETPTPESAISKALCLRAGARYIGFGRDNDYYPRMLSDIVRWSGAMWSIEDSHYLGVKHIIDQVDADLVMTACTTDWLFKGYGLEKKYRQIFGKNLPIKDFYHERIEGFLPNYPRKSPSEFAESIDQRMNAWFSGCPDVFKSERDWLSVEDRRIRPTAYTVSVSGQIMYRTYPYDTFLADSRVAECYGKLPAKWKLNGQVWGLAAALVCEKANDIVDANFGWPVDSSTGMKLLSFGRGWIARRLARMSKGKSDAREADHPPSTASWPDYGWYALHSVRLREFWHQTDSSDRELMFRIWGSDPWKIPLEEWARNPYDLMRIITMLQHWRQL